MGVGILTAATVGTALLGSGAAIGSALINKRAQENANEANLNLAREQMAYQTSEREAAQEYNTPANQRARFEQAGINPYLALGQIDSGNASAQTGVTTHPSQPVNALAGLMDYLGDLPSDLMSKMQGFQQVQAQGEAIKQARVDTFYKGQEKLLQMRQLKSDIALKMSQVDKTSQEYKNLQQDFKKISREIDAMDINLKYQDRLVNAQTEREEHTAGLVYEQKREAFWKAELAEQTSNAFPELNKKQLDLLSSQTYQAIQSGNLSSQMSQTEKVKRVGEILNNGIKSNEFSLQQLNITKEELDAARKGDVSKLRKNSVIFRFIDDAIDYTTDKAGTILGFAAGRFSRGPGKPSNFPNASVSGNTISWSK